MEYLVTSNTAKNSLNLNVNPIADINLVSEYKLSFKSVNELADINYSIIGDGDYVVSLLALIQRTHGHLPKRIYVRSPNENLPADLQFEEKTLSEGHEEVLVLGTNLYQLEMMTRLENVVFEKTQFVDVLAGKGNLETLGYYHSQIPSNQNYLIFFAVNPVDNFNNFLGNFKSWLESQGIPMIIRHPMQTLTDQELLSASGVIVWNGAMAIHQPILYRCENLQVEVTYAECGFFPQHEHFYFDKKGVNAKSQLYDDELNWLEEKAFLKLEKIRDKYRPKFQVRAGNYIFVPLQVPSDSNIINNSRFNNGMQEFIDYIEEIYPQEIIYFKPHPKDRLKSSYKFKRGLVVEGGDLIKLIAEAKLVHGINSSVLYEAALIGKDIKVEGNCLLKTHQHQNDKLLAAMVARQFAVSDELFDSNKLRRFSHIKGL
jgi:hypothetical protein